MFHFRTDANLPHLRCPDCAAEAGRSAAAPIGAADQWYKCMECDSFWREDTSTDTAPAARQMYFAADRETGKWWRRLARSTNPYGRWTALANLASLCDDMAAASLVWDNDRTDNHGFTPAEWAATEARLLRAVMHTERDLTYLHDGLPSLCEGDDHLLESFGAQAADVMDRLSTTDRPGRRAALVGQLWGAVVGDVGSQAAEVLGSVEHAYRRLQDRVDGACWYRPWTWRRLFRWT